MNQDFFTSLLKFRKNIIETLKSVEFTQLDADIAHEQVVPLATYSPWKNDSEFNKIYSQIKTHTLVDVYRCYELWNLTRNTRTVDADILEVGVWKGGTGALLAFANNEGGGNTILADTFSGVVKAGEQDTIYKGGEHSDTSLETVTKLLEITNAKRVNIIQGIFPESASNYNFDKGIKICHIDVDTYESAKDIFEWVWDKMIKGGVVIFDDYGYWGCEGVTKLFNALDVNRSGVKIHNLNGHGLVIRL